MKSTIIILSTLAYHLTTLSSSHASPTPSGSSNGLPLDLYLLIDSSGSIGAASADKICRTQTQSMHPPQGYTCWQLIATFTSSLTTSMAALAGGYAPNALSGGLRLSMYSFSCNWGTPVTRTWISGPSGDQNAIQQAMSALLTVTPHGGTCPSEGLTYIKNEITNTISTPGAENRPSAVIIITDGRTDHSNAKLAQDAADAIRNTSSATSMFAVPLGQGGANAESQLLGFVGGDSGHLFPASSAAALSDLVNLLAALMLGKMTIAWAPTPDQTAQAVQYDPKASWCEGETVQVWLKSNALLPIPLSELSCSITVQGSTPYTSAVVRQGNNLYCSVNPVSVSLIAGNGVSVQVVVTYKGRNLFTSQLQLTNKLAAFCVTTQFVDPGTGCFPPLSGTGGEGQIIFSGPTIDFASQQGPLTCTFGTITVTPVQNGPSWQCAAPPSDVVKGLQAGTDPTPFSDYDIQAGSIVLMDGQGSNGDIISRTCVDSTVVFPQSSPETPAGVWCYDYTLSSAPFASWTGTTIDNIVTIANNANQLALEWSCEYAPTTGGTTTVYDVTATLMTDGSVQCAPPPASVFSQVTQDTPIHLTVVIRVRAAAGASTRGWWTLSKTARDFSFISSPCLTPAVVPFVDGDGACVGSPLAISFSGAGVGLVTAKGNPLGGLSQLKCVFTDAGKNNRVVNAPITVIAPDQLQCTASSFSNAGFISVQLVAGTNTVVLHSFSLQGAQNECLTPSLLSDTSTTGQACWGQTDPAKPLVTFSGASVRSLVQSSTGNSGPPPVLQCQYVYNSITFTTVPLLVNLGAKTATCGGPIQIYGTLSATPSALSLTILKDGTEFQTFSFPAFQIVSCLQRKPWPVAPGSGLADDMPSCAPDCCLTSTLNFDVTGPGRSLLSSCTFFDASGASIATGNFSTINGCPFPKTWSITDTNWVSPASVSVSSSGNNIATLQFSSQPVNTICVGSHEENQQIVFGQPLVIDFYGSTLNAVLATGGGGNSIICVIGGTEFNLTSVGNSVTCTSHPLFSNVDKLQLIYRAAGATAGRRSLRGGDIVMYSRSLADVSVGAHVTLQSTPCLGKDAPEIVLVGAGAPYLSGMLQCEFPGSLTTSTTYSAAQGDVTCPIPSSLGVGPSSYSIILLSTGATLWSGPLSSCPPPTSSPVPTVPTLPTSSPSSNTNSTNGTLVVVPPPLSGGAIAGIVICVIVGLLALLFIVLIAKKRRSTMPLNNNTSKPDTAIPPPSPIKPDVETGQQQQQPAAPDDAPIVEFNVPVPPPVIVVTTDKDEDFPLYSVVQVREGKEWTYLATITKIVKKNETYIVNDDVTVPRSDIRWPEYHRGDQIEYKREGEGWEPGVVEACHNDDPSQQPHHHMIKVQGVQDEFQCRHIRPAPFKVGDHVEECGPDKDWRPAVITAINQQPGGDVYEYTLDGAGGIDIVRKAHRVRWPRYAGGDMVDVRVQGEWLPATVVTLEAGSVIAIQSDGVDPKRYVYGNVRPHRVLGFADTSLNADQDSGASLLGEDGRDARRNKYKVKAPLHFEELPDNCFEIVVDKKNGLGVSLGWTKSQTIVVAAFRNLKNKDWGPLEASDLVGLKDQVLAVNGVSVTGRSFAAVADMIRSSPDEIKIKFGRWGKDRVDLALA